MHYDYFWTKYSNNYSQQYGSSFLPDNGVKLQRLNTIIQKIQIYRPRMPAASHKIQCRRKDNNAIYNIFCREEGKHLMLAFKLFSGNATLGINNFSNLKLYVFRFGFR